jgi:hypothetical protein
VKEPESGRSMAVQQERLGACQIQTGTLYDILQLGA